MDFKKHAHPGVLFCAIKAAAKKRFIVLIEDRL